MTLAERRIIPFVPRGLLFDATARADILRAQEARKARETSSMSDAGKQGDEPKEPSAEAGDSQSRRLASSNMPDNELISNGLIRGQVGIWVREISP